MVIMTDMPDMNPGEDFDAETGEILPPKPTAMVAPEDPFGGTIMGPPRNPDKVMARLRKLCARQGMNYVYSWTVKDRQNNRNVLIEGATIKLANDLFREYGNCRLRILEVDNGPSWTFYALFIDKETGAEYMRSFRQDKGKNIGGGMKDQSRRLDMVYQIGQSKAIRNVIVNVLSNYADYMVSEAKKGLLEWVEGHGEDASKWIVEMLGKHNIDLLQVEAVVGKIIGKWSARDQAAVMAQLRGIDENLTTAEEEFPAPEDAKQVLADKEKKKADKAPKKEPKPKDEPEQTAEEPVEEPKAEKPETSDDDGLPSGMF